MKIPESVRIGGVDYAVVEKSNLNDGTNMCYGHIDYQITKRNAFLYGTKSFTASWNMRIWT